MLDSEIQQIADDAGAAAVAVAFHDFESGEAWSVHGDRPFHAASTMKVGVLAALLAAVAEGRYALDDRLHVRNRFLSVVDGEPYRIDAGRDANDAVHSRRGRTMRLGVLAEHMIQTSSNLATNLLLDLLGVEAVQAAVERLVGAGVEVRRGVEDERAYEAGVVNTATAVGLVRLFVAIEAGEGIGAEEREEALRILFGQEFSSGIPAGVPEGAGARFAHKTGSISTVQHDAGLVYFPDRRPYALAVLTEWPADVADGRREAVAACSRAVYRHLTATDG